MIKSKSAYMIKKKYQVENSPSEDKETRDANTKKKVEFDCPVAKLPRDPISVPNFNFLNLPTPVLTPVEVTKLVYLDSDEEKDLMEKESRINQVLEKNSLNIYENFQPVKKGDSYCSHLGYADNPLYQQMIQENSVGYVSSTSDYASIETVNRLSSASNYSVKTGISQDENQKNKERDKSGPFGFCNPNYMNSEIKNGHYDDNKKNAVKILSKTDQELISEDDDSLELQNFSGIISKDTKVYYRHSCRPNKPPRSLALDHCQTRPNVDKCRAVSASRVEKKTNLVSDIFSDPNVPFFVFVIGGKEQGQVTVFQRPISIWRLKLV